MVDREYGQFAERLTTQERALADTDLGECFSKDTFARGMLLLGTREDQIKVMRRFKGLRRLMHDSLKLIRDLNA